MKKIQGKMPFPWLLLASLLISLTTVACPTPGPVPPAPDADSGDDNADAAPATCANWCKHAAALKCLAAAPTAHGASCVTVCTNMQQSSVSSFNLRCRIAAKTCDLAEACEKGK